jgi:exodeoxyribonuclease VII small subunit
MSKGRKQTFEEALESLEGIVAQLEREDLSLDEALDYFEKGVKLMRVCEESLRGVEGKLRELLKGEDGKLVEKVLGFTYDGDRNGDEIEQ